MRILSVAVRNYRIHRELAIELDPLRTIIGGPNEAGKSTLVEAIHRCLFLKSRGNTQYHRVMRSNCHIGNPQVELEFEACGRRISVKKTFGSSGTTQLSTGGSAPLQDDEAEHELARILGVEPCAGRTMHGQWSHLWIWQGQAGSDPSSDATEQRNALISRLQEMGTSSVLQSDLDTRIAAHFTSQQQEFFTQRGAPKANSPLHHAEQKASEAAMHLKLARQRLLELESAAEEFENATREIESAETVAGQLSEEKQKQVMRAKQIAELQNQEVERREQHNTLLHRLTEQQEADRSIRQLRDQIRALEAELQPEKDSLASLRQSLAEAKSLIEQREKEYLDATSAVRGARKRHDFADAWMKHFALAEREQKLVTRFDAITARQKQQSELQSELAELQPVDEQQLSELRESANEVTRAQAALQVMAAGVEVLSSSDRVTIGDEEAAPGHRRVVTDDTVITIGKVTTLKITPGGGTSLSETRRRADEAKKQHRERLDALEVDSDEQASEVYAKRQGLSQRVASLTAELEGMDPTGLDAELSAVQAQRRESEASVHRKTSQLVEAKVPTDSESAESLVHAIASELSELTSCEEVSQKVWEQEKQRFQALGADVNQKEQAIADKTQELIDRRNQLDGWLQIRGQDEARREKLEELEQATRSALEQLNETQESIRRLEPDLLESDLTRVQRAMDKQSGELSDWKARRAVASSQLRSDGQEDPRQVFAMASERSRLADEQASQARRRAEAVRLLDRLFREEQQALADRFAQPLAEKVSGYLQCIFGSDARAMVKLESDAFTGLHLQRDEAAEASCAFEMLSGGAREQMAAAVRLAMAEILAADFDGCLPVVFDDAFAYSDPIRVTQLQRMLDLAATRGLQLIILTCNPADYAALGAEQRLLRHPSVPVRPRYGRGGSDNVNADSAGGGSATASRPSAALGSGSSLHEEFLRCLEQLGGRSGNQTLRESLGWDESQYDGVKGELISAGKIEPGRGRGGSVAVVVETDNALQFEP